MKLGTADIVSLKAGSSNVSKIMLGTTEVWSGEEEWIEHYFTHHGEVCDGTTEAYDGPYRVSDLGRELNVGYSGSSLNYPPLELGKAYKIFLSCNLETERIDWEADIDNRRTYVTKFLYDEAGLSNQVLKIDGVVIDDTYFPHPPEEVSNGEGYTGELLELSCDYTPTGGDPHDLFFIAPEIITECFSGGTAITWGRNLVYTYSTISGSDEPYFICDKDTENALSHWPKGTLDGTFTGTYSMGGKEGRLSTIYLGSARLALLVNNDNVNVVTDDEYVLPVLFTDRTYEIYMSLFVDSEWTNEPDPGEETRAGAYVSEDGTITNSKMWVNGVEYAPYEFYIPPDGYFQGEKLEFRMTLHVPYNPNYNEDNYYHKNPIIEADVFVTTLILHAENILFTYKEV